MQIHMQVRSAALPVGHRLRFSGIDAETLHGPYTTQNFLGGAVFDLHKYLKLLVAGAGFRTHRLALAA
jgi:hypothetical protein